MRRRTAAYTLTSAEGAAPAISKLCEAVRGDGGRGDAAIAPCCYGPVSRPSSGSSLPLVRRQERARLLSSIGQIWLVAGRSGSRKCANIRPPTTEYETARFYRKAAEQSRDVSVAGVAGQALPDAEDKHEDSGRKSSASAVLTEDVRAREDRDRSADVRPAIRSAWACRPDGRLSVHGWRTCSPQRSRPIIPGRRSWSALAAFGGRRNFHGLRRKPCPTMASLTGARARRCCAGRSAGLMTFLGGIGPHPALSDPKFLGRDRGVHLWWSRLSSRRFVCSLPLHGHAISSQRAFQVVVGGGARSSRAGILIGSS